MTDESKQPPPDSAPKGTGSPGEQDKYDGNARDLAIAIAGILGVVAVLYAMMFLAKRMNSRTSSVDEVTTRIQHASPTVKTSTSTILGGSSSSSRKIATPAASPPVAAPKAPATSLANVAKFEMATLNEGAGAAYNEKLKNLPLTSKAIPLDSKDATEARALLDRYLAADGWRGKIAYVFQPERVEALMRDYYDKRGAEEPVPGKQIGASVITGGSSTVVNLTFACPSRPAAGLRANYHRINAGKLLLDWEAWVAFSERAWPDFKHDRQIIPTLMRAVAAEDDYYNYEFAAERWRYLAVKLRSPDGVHSLTGYCVRSSALGIAMANLIGVPLPQKTDKEKPGIPIRPPGTKSIVTVRLAFPASAQSDHCVWITDLLADRWMLFDGEY